MSPIPSDKLILLEYHVERLRKTTRGLDGYLGKMRLKRKGWSYRSAAEVLGISYQHLSCVLNGQRDSRRVMLAIANLPERRRAA